MKEILKGWRERGGEEREEDHNQLRGSPSEPTNRREEKTQENVPKKTTKLVKKIYIKIASV